MNYTKSEVENFLRQAQQAILNNQKDAAMNVDYSVEWFRDKVEGKGDWVYVIKAQCGAYGANGQVGKVTTSIATNGVENDCGDKGLRIRIGETVWNIGEDYQIRYASLDEINKATSCQA